MGDRDAGRPNGAIAFFRDRFGLLRTFDYPGAVNTAAFGINDGDSVLIVGAYDARDGTTHGFISDGSNFVTIDYPGAPNTELRGINVAGEIVGIFYEPGGVTIRGFFATPN